MAASGIIRCQSQNFIAVILFEKICQIPGTHPDIRLYIVQLGRTKIFHPHLFSNPFACIRHNLHQTAGTPVRRGRPVKLAFHQNHCRYQRRIHVVFIGILSDHIVILQRIYDFTHYIVFPGKEIRRRETGNQYSCYNFYLCIISPSHSLLPRLNPFHQFMPLIPHLFFCIFQRTSIVDDNLSQ